MKDPKWRSLIVLAAAGLACGAAAAKGPAGVSSHVRRVGQDAQWAEIQGLLSKCVGVYASPGRLYPNFTPDGPFMGNGDMHVALLGGPHRQVFHISKSDMWTDDRNICPITFGGVTISPDANTDITAFRQEHDILHAEVRATSAAGFKTKSFVANENVLLTELWTDGSVGIPMHVDVWARADRPQYPAKAGVDGAARILWVTRETCGGPKARWVTRAALAVAIEGVSITTRTDGLGKNTASFTLKPGKKATLYTVLAGGKDATTHLKDAKAKVVTLNAPKAAALSSTSAVFGSANAVDS